MGTKVPSVARAQTMPVFPSPLDAEAEAGFVGSEFPPSPLWARFPVLRDDVMIPRFPGSRLISPFLR